jgi:histidinol phosphatase-like enzyme (inositol monophosphatase family)
VKPGPVSPELIAFANRLADVSGPIVKTAFRNTVAIETKPDHTPVTEIDRAAEAALRAIIERERPDDGFIGEETERKPSRNNLTWVLDPIDGTKAFLCGKATFGTLIALLWRDTPILGVIDQPVLGERWVGVSGEASVFNGAPIDQAVRRTSLSQARIATTGPGNFSDAEYKAFRHVANFCAITHYGGDCYNYGLVALGHIDIVMEANLKLYDYAALIPVIEGAGGVVTAWDGGKAGHDGTILAAASPILHLAALERLAEVL